MTWHGFPPEGVTLLCKDCGCELSGEYGPRPAETYAGTYTGLCYACQRKGPYPVESHVLDRAVTWSHPPLTPAHRRARRRFVHYDDCGNPRCRKGRVVVSRSNAMGGRYAKSCDECFARFYEHPLRRWRKHGWARIYEAANNVFRRQQSEILETYGLEPGDVPAIMRGEHVQGDAPMMFGGDDPRAELESLRDRTLARAYALRDRMHREQTRRIYANRTDQKSGKNHV